MMYTLVTGEQWCLNYVETEQKLEVPLVKLEFTETNYIDKLCKCACQCKRISKQFFFSHKTIINIEHKLKDNE